ncbi:MAG: hypothetical protein Q8M08_02930 [Bacteroidales bacterium]|nr:hypothetical protein [Bacteroidales bacterium]
MKNTIFNVALIAICLFSLSIVTQAQTIQLTITDNNYVSGDQYALHYAIYDYTLTPTLQYIDYPNPFQTFSVPTTFSNVTIPFGVPKDAAATIYEIKIRVYKNGSVYRDDTSGLINSDGYYAGNIPLSVSF